MDIKKSEGIGKAFEGDGKKAWGRVKEALFDGKIIGAVLWGVFAFALCGQVAFGCGTLGVSLLGCVGDNLYSVALGTALGSIFLGRTDALPSVCVTAGVLLFRFLTRKQERNAAGDYALSLASAAAIGIVKLMRGGFLFYDLFGFALSCILSPILTFSYRLALRLTEGKYLKAEAGQILLAAALIASLREESVFGFSPAIFCAVFLTAYLGKNGGAMKGTAVGCLLGLVIRPILAPSFGVLGLLFGLLRDRSLLYACSASVAAVSAVQLYAEGSAALLSFLPDFAAGILISAPILKWNRLPQFFPITVSGFSGETTGRNGRKLLEGEEAEIRLSRMSESLKSLSEVFFQLSDRLKTPKMTETRLECEKCFRPYCLKCPLSTVCWGRECASTEDAMNKISEAVCRDGQITVGSLPGYLAERCKQSEKIVRDINRSQIKLLEKAAGNDRMEVMALDYGAIASLLGEAGKKSQEEGQSDRTLTEKAQRTAACLGISASYLFVCGTRTKRVVIGGMKPAGLRISPEKMSEIFGRTVGMKLTLPEIEDDRGFVTVTMRTAKKIRITGAQCGCEKEGEEISGDSVLCFDNRENYYYTLLSDGMGSGKEAAMTSKMCAVFLHSMLQAGNPKSVVLKMLNSFIRAKNLECFATVDLLEVDLYTGRASFVKGGAAPSFILRDGRLFRLSSRSLPVGITREISAEEIAFDLLPGDTVVMISDGIAQSFEESLWLCDLLTYGWKEDDTLQTMAQRILSEATGETPRKDDRTVALMRVEEA